MLKPGIHRLDQLRLEHLTSWWGRRKLIAIDLYPQIAAANLPDRDELQQHALLRFALANGTFKRTYGGRFRDFDREAIAIALDAFPPPCALRVHDMAVSDGRTSVDFFEALAERYGQGLRFHASDLVPYVWRLQRAGEPLRVIVDDEDHVLQVIRPPFVFSVPRPEDVRLYPLNHAIRRMLQARAVPRLLAAAAAGQAERTRIDLVHAECAKRVRDDARFELTQHDITRPVGSEFHVVRAMNILNPDYFDAATLEQIVGHVCGSVAEGGVLVTGSNQGPDSPVLGSIFRKSGGRFEELHASAGGSPVRALVSGG